MINNNYKNLTNFIKKFRGINARVWTTNKQIPHPC
nr:MAG TPA: hypothetical protein [Bacteriophage sp.]